MDMTCQDGYTSGIVCNLLVDNDNIVYTTHDGLGAHRGVEAYNVLGDPAVRGGDSGGLVFALTGGTRQARGIVSAGGDELGSGNRYILWTEAPFIFSTFGMTLA